MDPTATLETATLTNRERRAPGFWCLRFRSPKVAAAARGAHYVAMDLPGPFCIRLPLGIWTAEGDEFSLLFREWGKRTGRLAALPVGTELSVIGPLGNQFRLPNAGARAVIVAGGVGIVPFWLLARQLQQHGVETRLLFGARSADALVGTEELAALNTTVDLCTDDGSHGWHGSVIDYLRTLPKPDITYGCGPPGMLRALCAYANETGIECQISMEETFGCSMGTCWGCVVPVRRGSPQGTGYPPAAAERRPFDVARVCTDGTVFEANDIVWSWTP